MELGKESSCSLCIGIVNLDLSLFFNVNSVSSCVTRSLNCFIINFFITLRNISFLRIIALIIKINLYCLLSLLKILLDFLKSCNLSLHPRMTLNLVNCKSLLIIILNHGSDKMEEVFGDRGELKAILFCNNCPVLFVLLLLNVLVEIVV